MIYGNIRENAYRFDHDVLSEDMLKNMDVLKLMKLAYADIVSQNLHKGSHYEVEFRFQQPTPLIDEKIFAAELKPRVFWLSSYDGFVQGFGFSCNFFDKYVLRLHGEGFKRKLKELKLGLSNIFIYSPEFANA